jgi:hypothetical protein
MVYMNLACVKSPGAPINDCGSAVYSLLHQRTLVHNESATGGIVFSTNIDTIGKIT